MTIGDRTRPVKWPSRHDRVILRTPVSLGGAGASGSTSGSAGSAVSGGARGEPLVPLVRCRLAGSLEHAVGGLAVPQARERRPVT